MIKIMSRNVFILNFVASIVFLLISSASTILNTISLSISDIEVSKGLKYTSLIISAIVAGAKFVMMLIKHKHQCKIYNDHMFLLILFGIIIIGLNVSVTTLNAISIKRNTSSIDLAISIINHVAVVSKAFESKIYHTYKEKP